MVFSWHDCYINSSLPYLEKQEESAISGDTTVLSTDRCATFNVLHLIGSQKTVRVSAVRSVMRDTGVLCVSVEVNPDVTHLANYKDAYQAERASRHPEQNINWEGGTAVMFAAC